MILKERQEKALLFFVCMVLGIMLAAQFKSAEVTRASISQQRAEDLAERLKSAEKEKATLQAKVEALEKGQEGTDLRMLQDLKARAGETALSGPGIKIVVNDSKTAAKPGENNNLYIIHDDDLLRLVNELRAAGAEALAMNGQRLLDVSEIRCAGPTVSVNNTRFTPPYEITAIGDAKTLESALMLRGGVVETLKFWGISVDVTKLDSLTIPAFKGARNFDFAKIKEGDAK